ncbi:hypothetical protein FACS1894217_11960 [Clostridia bacterium]|nr:hypothetical protein FACS1894217_11960 [Clostridia bacterium]
MTSSEMEAKYKAAQIRYKKTALAMLQRDRVSLKHRQATSESRTTQLAPRNGKLGDVNKNKEVISHENQ